MAEVKQQAEAAVAQAQEQAKAIYEGVCDVAIANTYYMGKMLTNEKKPEQKDCTRLTPSSA